MIRILVADDQALVRAGFCALLEATDGLEVVAEAVDGADAVDLAARHEPDIVLMDIRMPRLDGIAATRQVLALPQPPHVLILTTFDTDDNVFDALEAGAVGFLVKDTPPTQLIEAIHAAMRGGAVISPGTTRRLVDRIIETRTDRGAASSHPVPGGFDVNRQERGRGVLEVLTSREREVLAMIARGMSNREIAGHLVISELTAKTHVSRVLGKLGLGSRVQAAVLAYEIGMVRPGEVRRSE